MDAACLCATSMGERQGCGNMRETWAVSRASGSASFKARIRRAVTSQRCAKDCPNPPAVEGHFKHFSIPECFAAAAAAFF